MIWLAPAALLGLIAIAVPIAIHLFGRRPGVRLSFPSLRFLRPSARRSAAIRVSDPALLAVRILIIACAVLALAQPVFLTAGRQAGWRGRIARAIVIDTSPGAGGVARGGDAPVPDADARAAAEVATAAFSRIIRSADLRLALGEAAAWLSTLPPARREILVYSPFAVGSLDSASLAALDAGIGLRFNPIARAQPAAALGWPVVHDAAGRRRVFAPVVSFDGDRTTVWRLPLDPPAGSSSMTTVRLDPGGATARLVDGSSDDAGAFFHEAQAACAPTVTMTSTSEGRATADAALRAVLAGGVPCAVDPAPRLRLAFSDAARPAAAATPSAPLLPWMVDAIARLAADPAGANLALDRVTGEDATLVVPAGGRAASADGLATIRSAFRALADDSRSDRIAPGGIDAATLESWTRPPGDPSDTAVVHEPDRDGRWLWLMVAGLLGAETWLRRNRRPAAQQRRETAA